MSVNWLGDVIMPIGVLAISLIASIWIAMHTRRQSLRDMTFQHDVRYADELLALLERRSWWDLVTPDAQSVNLFFAELNAARVRFTDRASGGADLYLASYLSSREQKLDRLWRELRARRPYLSQMARGNQAEARELRIADVGPEQKEQINRAFADMQQVVRDWPFVNRRRDILRGIAQEMIDSWAEPPSDRELAIDRLMLTMDRDANWLRRLHARADVTVRALVDDARYGRLGARLEWWRHGIRESRIARESLREPVGARREQRREAIARRKLYEQATAHYRRSGLTVPHELPPGPQ